MVIARADKNENQGFAKELSWFVFNAWLISANAGSTALLLTEFFVFGNAFVIIGAVMILIVPSVGVVLHFHNEPTLLYDCPRGGRYKVYRINSFFIWCYQNQSICVII